MALTKQNLHQLSYLLEVAPLSTPVNARVLCCQTSLWQGQRKRVLQCGRRHASTAGWKKAPATPAPTASAPKPRASATGALLEDAILRRQPVKRAAIPVRASLEPSPAPEMTDGPALDRLNQVLTDAKQPLLADRAVPEKDVLTSLKLCRDLARYFKESTGADDPGNASPAMKLLFLAEGESTEHAGQRTSEQVGLIRKRAMKSIAEAAHQIVTDPKVFITADILSSYVQFRSYLEQPDDLAEIFDLYANKPVPQPNTTPVQYSVPSPTKPASAVPIETAQIALDAAISTRNLPLCLDIINTTVCTRAFYRYKLIQQALLPFTGFAALPFAAYAFASQFAMFQQNMDTATAKWVGFAGILSYIGFTGTIGVVAVTTANDQMERVTWADGVPLRQRWLREPERAMLDKVACAWGFKTKERWGEENSPEWDALKELIGLRGMVLDKVELMEGMA